MKTVLSILLAFILSGCFFRSTPESAAQKAERAENEGDLVQAEREYERHIRERLAIKNRPEWENPYFYLLRIGDIKLKQDDFKGALAEYDRALKEGVDKQLVGDRIITACKTIEDKGRIKEAYSVLKKYEKLDPPLFAISLDRLARKITN